MCQRGGRGDERCGAERGKALGAYLWPARRRRCAVGAQVPATDLRRSIMPVRNGGGDSDDGGGSNDKFRAQPNGDGGSGVV